MDVNADAVSAAADVSELPLGVPDDFSFPYATPYAIQTALMRVRYD